MQQIYFIRHGHTTGDTEDRYGGAYNDALSKEGETQVAQLVSELANSGIRKIYSSPLLRAQQTAQSLAVTLTCTVTIIEDIKERNQYGQLTGMMKQEACQKYPGLVEMVKDRLNTLPQAESYAEASLRTNRAFEEITSNNESCLAIVAHGGGLRILFRDILKHGELKEIGDCSWVKLERETAQSPFRIMDSKRLIF